MKRIFLWGVLFSFSLIPHLISGEERPYKRTVFTHPPVSFSSSAPTSVARSTDSPPSSLEPTLEGPVPLGDPVENPIQPGEKFEFVLKYEFVAAGSATMETTKSKPINGRPAIYMSSKARSNKFIDVFFKVRDFNSSIVDAETLASYKFHQNLREGGYKVVRNKERDYQTGDFTYVREYKGETKTFTGKFTEPASDILSSFFYVRTLPLELGGEYAVNVFSDEEIYPLKVTVDDEYDTVKVPAGKFECFRLKPQVVGDAIFKAKDGKMTIWVTKDPPHMPVMIKSKVFIGSFDAELTDYSLPKNDK